MATMIKLAGLMITLSICCMTSAFAQITNAQRRAAIEADILWNNWTTIRPADWLPFNAQKRRHAFKLRAVANTKIGSFDAASLRLSQRGKSGAGIDFKIYLPGREPPICSSSVRGIMKPNQWIAGLFGPVDERGKLQGVGGANNPCVLPRTADYDVVITTKGFAELSFRFNPL